MAKTKLFPLPDDPEKLVGNARRLAKERGFEFEGDTCRGRFKGKGVEGTYSSGKNGLSITITKKPLIYPWFAVWQRTQQLFVETQP